jgi:hypothetical protein
LFRSLFHERDDVYAVRWENADGRSGYMPKADRDWKAYLRAKGEDRKKVDRQTREFRPLTDEVATCGSSSTIQFPQAPISCFQAFSGITLGLLRDKCAAVR